MKNLCCDRFTEVCKPLARLVTTLDRLSHCLRNLFYLPFNGTRCFEESISVTSLDGAT